MQTPTLFLHLSYNPWALDRHGNSWSPPTGSLTLKPSRVSHGMPTDPIVLKPSTPVCAREMLNPQAGVSLRVIVGDCDRDVGQWLQSLTLTAMNHGCFGLQAVWVRPRITESSGKPGTVLTNYQHFCLFLCILNWSAEVFIFYVLNVMYQKQIPHKHTYKKCIILSNKDALNWSEH